MSTPPPDRPIDGEDGRAVACDSSESGFPSGSPSANQSSIGTDAAECAKAARIQRPRAVRWFWRSLRLPLLLAICAILMGRCGMAERLFYHPIKEATPAPLWLHPDAEAFWIETNGAPRLRAWFVPAAASTTGEPERDARSSLPATIVHLHGNAGNMNYHIDFTSHLSAAGFNLVLVDYRGYGESDGTAARRADLIDDARRTLHAVAERPDVDASRIGVYGQSLGGAIAISAIALEASERGGVSDGGDGGSSGGSSGDSSGGGVPVRALVLESPFASWRDIAANAVGGDPPLWPARIFASWLIDDSHRPLDAAAELTMPTLIVHGDADRIVPASHGRRLAEVIPDVTLHVLSGGDHNTLLRTHPETAELVRTFFRERLTVIDGDR